jgi:hypothetical protein
MKFKELEIKDESSWLRKTFTAKHTRKTIVSFLVGALAGFLFFYITEGHKLDAIVTADIVQSMLVGGFFGFFVSNSPCARNKC